MSNHPPINRDLAPERQERIRELVRERGVVKVEDLTREIDVSAATIRRDLEALEDRGLLRRVHGGAVRLESSLEEPLFDDKTSVLSREKQGIARKAAELIKAGDTIFLDGGSTVLELARLLRDRSDITVVTNSLRAAIELSGRGPQLFLVGGEFRRRSQTVVGPLTRLLLAQLHVDRAFMGTIGITAAEGLTTTDANEAFTKELVAQQAREVILLVDSTKIGKVSFARAGNIAILHTLITDAAPPPSFVRALNKHRINLITVN